MIKNKGDNGFTLVELLVVVVVISILALVAIPTFLSQREKAQDADAKSTLRNAMTSLQATKGGEATWEDGDINNSQKLAIKLGEDQSGYTVMAGVDPESNGPKEINVVLANDRKHALLATRSDSRRFICVYISASGAPVWATSTISPADCYETAGATPDELSGASDVTPDEVDISLANFAGNTSTLTSPTFNITADSGNTVKCKTGSGAYTNAAGSGTSFTYVPTSPLSSGSKSVTCYQLTSNLTPGEVNRFDFSVADLPLCNTTWERATGALNYFDGFVSSAFSSNGIVFDNWGSYTNAQTTSILLNNLDGLPCLADKVVSPSPSCTITSLHNLAGSNQFCAYKSGNNSMIIFESTDTDYIYLAATRYYEYDEYDEETGAGIGPPHWAGQKSNGCLEWGGPGTSSGSGTLPGESINWGAFGSNDTLYISAFTPCNSFFTS